MATETVLIIEDDPTMLRVLKDNFEYTGFAVKTADDRQRGLQAALAGTVDLIVLDIMLPGINGYEICRRVRQQGIDAPIRLGQRLVGHYAERGPLHQYAEEQDRARLDPGNVDQDDPKHRLPI